MNKVILHGKGHQNPLSPLKNSRVPRQSGVKIRALPKARPPWDIVFMSPCWFRGGLEAVTINHLRKLDRSLFRPSLLVGMVSDGAEDSVPKDVHIRVHPECFEWSFPPHPSHTNKAKMASQAILKKLCPDVVVGQLSHGPMFGADAAKVPLIAEYWHSAGGWDILSHPSDLIISVSQWAKDFVTARRDVNVPVHVVWNGIDNDLFHVVGSKNELKQKLGLPQDGIIIGFSGRIDPQKNPILWVEIAAAVKRDCPVTGLMCGPIHHHALFNTVRHQADALGFEFTHVSVSYKEMANYYGAMDILLHPTVMETFGLIAIESILCGTPVVSNAVGGLVEIAKEINTPEMFSVVDVQDLTSCVSTINRMLDGAGTTTIPEVASVFRSDNMTKRLQSIIQTSLQSMI